MPQKWYTRTSRISSASIFAVSLHRLSKLVDAGVKERHLLPAAFHLVSQHGSSLPEVLQRNVHGSAEFLSMVLVIRKVSLHHAS